MKIHTATSRTAVIVVLLFAIPGLAVAGGPERRAGSGLPESGQQELRRHFAISTASERFVATEIIRMDDTTDANTVLIRDARGDSLVLRRSTDFDAGKTTYEITSPTTPEFMRATFSLPERGLTRKEALQNAVSIRDSSRHVDTIITIETPGVVRTARESEWNDPETSNDLRSDLRRSMTAGFLDTIVRLRSMGVFSVPPLDAMDAVLIQRVQYPAMCDSPRAAKVDRLIPDCRFDAAFGYRCSDRQARRAEKARETGEIPALY